MSSDTDRMILSNLIKRAQRGIDDPLRPLYDRYILKRDQTTRRVRRYIIDLKPRARPGGRLSPSTIGGCKRQAVFKFVGVRGRKRIDPDSEAIFDHGTWTHHKWQATFKDMQAVLGKEVFHCMSIEGPVQIDDLFVAGNFDAVVRINGRYRYVIDIKSINDMGFTRVVTNDEPLPHHVEQLITYMYAKGIRRGILWYENKNDQRTHGFVVEYSREEWVTVRRWCESVVASLEQQRLPDRHSECEHGSFLYDRCPWSRLCFGQMSEDDVQQLVYRNFVGVTAAWEAGHAAMEET